MIPLINSVFVFQQIKQTGSVHPGFHMYPVTVKVTLKSSHFSEFLIYAKQLLLVPGSQKAISPRKFCPSPSASLFIYTVYNGALVCELGTQYLINITFTCFYRSHSQQRDLSVIFCGIFSVLNNFPLYIDAWKSFFISAIFKVFMNFFPSGRNNHHLMQIHIIKDIHSQNGRVDLDSQKRAAIYWIVYELFCKLFTQLYSFLLCLFKLLILI